jgi:hypothetical protein
MFSVGDLINGQSLTSLAESARTAFQNTAAQIQTRWNKQHANDGAHRDVTAASLVLAGALKCNGRLNIGAPLHLRRPLEADTQPFYLGGGGRGAAAALATFVRIQTSSLDPSPLLWHGLDAAGREEGDVVFFLNDGNDVCEFIVDSGSAPLNTRFAGNSTAASGNIELHSSALAISVYAHDTFLGSKYWHTLALF